MQIPEPGEPLDHTAGECSREPLAAPVEGEFVPVR